MEQIEITLGFSPCPNDCFIFDAMVNGRLDTGNLKFKVVMEDVETLNRMAMDGILDVTKLSFNAFGFLTDKYCLLESGSALGKNCGPLLIAKKKYGPEEIPGLRIAIPGKFTTANFLLALAFPEAKNKKEMVFSGIEDAVLNGDCELGLIIHENRFTYQEKGLVKLLDLGEFWEKLANAPIPLGGIAVHKRLPQEIQEKTNILIHESISQAFANPSDSRKFVRENASEMDEEVMQKHINLYVNEYSLELGENGRKAVSIFLEKGFQAGWFPKPKEPVFLF